MRFECDSCHAKYKISDDKVRGRVVRFPCRKCDHKILIDGRKENAEVTVPAGAAYNFEEVTRKSEPVSQFSAHEAATARARRPSSPARRRPSSVPPRRPSAAARRVSSVPAAAASALVGQHPGLAPPVPSAAAAGQVGEAKEAPEWHVSINDVPIGPIRLEEMGHKIDAGAVSEYSLVWREGFDEWRPLATVPQLMSLLHQRRHSGPPSRSSFSSMPPFVETRTPLKEPSPPADLPSPPSTFPDAPSGYSDTEIAPLADALQPEAGVDAELSEMSQPPAPIGPDDVFQSSPQLGSFSGLPPTPDEQVSVPAVPPEPAAATAEPESRLSLGILALIVAVAVFSGVVAFLAFDRFGDDLLKKWVREAKPAKVVAPAPEQVDPPPPVEVEETEVEEAAAEDGLTEEEGVEGLEAAPLEGEEVTEDETEAAEAAETEATETAAVVPPPDPTDNSPKMVPASQPKPKARRKPRPQPVATAPKSDLSASEQKLLDEYGGANTAPAKIDVKDSGSTQSEKPPLDGDAVRATVTANKPRLQRCYERAIRGQQSPPAVRLDVTVTVTPSGRVKAVSSEGSGPGGLAECIEASVRRWRFPASAEGGPAKFPIVFSAN